VATTVAQLVTRATDKNVANRGASLVPADAVVLNLVDTFQQDLITRLANDNRIYGATSEVLTSSVSTGGSARAIDLADLTIPALKVLKLVREEDGQEIAIVDIRDTDAEYAPRATVAGTVVTEVYPDWDEGDPGAVDIRVHYIHGIALLDIDGALTQTVGIPDQFCDLLVLRLARYLATKDQGRDAGEVKQLDADYEARYQAFVSYLDNLAGTQAAGLTPPVAGRKP
jgi:hypothetical protein